MCSAATEKNVVKMWYYVVICGNMWTSGHQIFSKHMALDGQFYFLVLFGWMPLIPEGFPAWYEYLAFNRHKQTTTLSVYVKPTSVFTPIILQISIRVCHESLPAAIVIQTTPTLLLFGLIAGLRQLVIMSRGLWGFHVEQMQRDVKQL